MRIVLISIFLGLITVASQAAVTGRVVDAGGNPVPDAMINYTNMANRLIYVYTNTAGLFCIPAPSEWSVNDLPMYKTPCQAVSVKQSRSINMAPSSLGMVLRGDAVLFTVREGSHEVSASIFDLAGRCIATAFDKTLGQGTYSFFPFAGYADLPRKVYAVRLSDGKSSQAVRMLNAGTRQRTGRIDEEEINGGGAASLSKVRAVDNIRAGKTGYTPGTAAVNSTTYSESVGDIRITAINVENEVNTVFSRMTLDQKLGQLFQCSNTSYITSNFAGSYLKGSSRSAMQSMQNSALGTGARVPLTIGSDFVHGGNPVYLPHNIGLGATGNPLLVELAYRIVALYCKMGNNVDFAPTLDVARNDKYGRVYECFSENVEDTKIMARAAVRGLQGTDISSDFTMIATAKHYAGAGGTQDGQMRGNTNTGTWAQLCSIHLPQFKAAVDAGVASVMTSYNNFLASPTNSAQVSMTAHRILITDTLKTAWGFDGFTISDWMQVYTPTLNRIADAFNAGLDVSMQPENTDVFISSLKGLVPGTISQSRVDDAVKRHLRVKIRMNLFNNPVSNAELANYTGSAENRAVARACVRQSLVLLKNNNTILPLKKNAKIRVVGLWADNMGGQCGGWSETGTDSWQGQMAAHPIAGATTIYQALLAQNSGGSVTYSETAGGIPTDVDAVVVAVGEVPYAEDSGYLSDITLSSTLQTLVQTCAASGKPVITILITGRPNALGTIPGNSTALVAAWLPGTEGTGIADLLYDNRPTYNFVGKLKFTWPATSSQEPINTGSMGDANNTGTPLYAYGYGLSY